MKGNLAATFPVRHLDPEAQQIPKLAFECRKIRIDRPLGRLPRRPAPLVSAVHALTFCQMLGLADGEIALARKNYGEALAHLGQANQQDPAVLYATAVALKGKGDAAKAKQLAAEAANANVLPLISYAFVRDEARRMS